MTLAALGLAGILGAYWGFGPEPAGTPAGRASAGDRFSAPQNPVFEGADPGILLLDGTLWVYPTSSSPQVYAYATKDLVNWRVHGPVLDLNDVDWVPEGRHAWAPGLAEKDGKYYLYYSVGAKPSHIGVAVADSPEGPFIDSGEPLLSDHGQPHFEAIDAMVFTDPESGTPYFYAGGSAGANLRIFELNEARVGFAREIETETPPHFTEAPFMHYRDGIYYLSNSRGFWGDDSYQVHYSTSETPAGPWTHRGAVLVSDETHKGPGHHAFFRNPGTDEWFIIYHRWNNRPGPPPYEGPRKIAIERVEYDERGLIQPIEMTNEGVGPVKLNTD